jgi:inner membrane transporter RhtA
MPTATFAVLMSLGPAIAAIAGYLILNQALTLSEALAVGLVAASLGAVRTAPPHPVSIPPPSPRPSRRKSAIRCVRSR